MEIYSKFYEGKPRGKPLVSMMNLVQTELIIIHVKQQAAHLVYNQYSISVVRSWKFSRKRKPVSLSKTNTFGYATC